MAVGNTVRRVFPASEGDDFERKVLPLARSFQELFRLLARLLPEIRKRTTQAGTRSAASQTGARRSCRPDASRWLERMPPCGGVFI